MGKVGRIEVSAENIRQNKTEDSNPAPILVHSKLDDELVCDIDESPPLLPCAEVDAVCNGVTIVLYGPYHQRKLVLDFRVFFPDEYVGVTLNGYFHYPKKWKNKPPVASKLWKAIQVATGGEARKRQRGLSIKKLFVGKAFRCKLRASGEGAAAYSTIEQVLERLTG